MNKAFKAMVGSKNCNLSYEDSDTDYKTFYFPSFDDMYSESKSSQRSITQREDNEYHDIRKFPNILWKSNINFIEVLFSNEVNQYDSALYEELYEMRDEISVMNLPYLWNTCYGIIHQGLKFVEKEILKEDVDSKKIGKRLHQANRMKIFLEGFEKSNFKEFESSIKISDGYLKSYLIDLKRGVIDNIDHSYKSLKIWVDSNEMSNLKEKYSKMKKNSEMKKKLEKIVKKHVRYHLLNELQ